MRAVCLCLISGFTFGALAACSQQDHANDPATIAASASSDPAVANAGPRRTAPTGLYGKAWKSHPTPDLKAYAPPIDGITIYVPKQPLAAFEGVPVAESDFEYDRGRLWGAHLYVDGAERRDAVKAALLKTFGSPDAKPSNGNDYSWSWPKRRIAVDMQFDSRHARTTVDFSTDTKDRSTDLPQLTAASDMDMLRAEDMSNAAQNMKLAILDGDRKTACANAKSIYYDGQGLAQSGFINTTQKKGMAVAAQFIRDQCPR